jgi:tRNA-dihydrouridine synthase B
MESIDLSTFQEPLKIGSFSLHSRVFQSPLAGVTDQVFRHLVRRQAKDSMVYTEMVSATGLHYARELPKIMEVGAGEHPIGIQLFDCRPNFLAEAAKMAEQEGADIIDINMGCPVNKITKNGGGSSLLREPEIAEAAVRAVVEAVNLPVTVKTRLGWSDQEITVVDFARRLEAAGASLLTIHGRTRAQQFTGAARWEWVRAVKEAVTIPVIVNGDVMDVDSAIKALAISGADGVMCARGTMGDPGLVGRVDHFLRTGERLPDPAPMHQIQTAREHLHMLWEYKGLRGIQQARKHLTWYVKGIPGASQLRSELARVESVTQGEELLDRALEAVMNWEKRGEHPMQKGKKKDEDRAISQYPLLEESGDRP